MFGKDVGIRSSLKLLFEMQVDEDFDKFKFIFYYLFIKCKFRTLHLGSWKCKNNRHKDLGWKAYISNKWKS